IIFGRPTGVEDGVAEKILLFSNPVENYLWFNLTGVESANVTIYNLSGEQVLTASVPNGESLYVGNLKSGNYLLTVVSGDKKLAARFLKK
ncbi:MAG: T9SS type A sorting domain-containing protein, partial [Paludibacteraceae bacterium]|nr:T9SS type A sorting domain-containing protein [Paludibacteraceae bacterium]